MRMVQGSKGATEYWNEYPLIASQTGMDDATLTYHLMTSAKVHICPLYLMRHVRDGGQNYQTPVDVWVIHTLINLG